MTRSPAASVCAGLTSDGLPVGIQLVGPQHADLVVIRSAAALETGHRLRRGRAAVTLPAGIDAGAIDPVTVAPPAVER